MRQNVRSGIIVIATVICLITVSIIMSLFSSSKPSKSAKTFLYDLSNKQIEAAYNTTSTQFKATVPRRTFDDFLHLYPILTTNVEIEFQNHSIDKDIATISANLKSEDGSRTPITLHVVKENGDWRLLALSLNPADQNRQDRRTSSEK